MSLLNIMSFSGQYDRYPSLIQQNTLNNNMGNPRLPPYPHPITIYPAYQIKQPLNVSMNPGNKNNSPTHSPTGVDNIFAVTGKFGTPRMCVVGSPKLGKERRGKSNLCICLLMLILWIKDFSLNRVPTGQGKVKEICFFFKVREKPGKSVKWSGNSGNP